MNLSTKVQFVLLN